MSIQELAMLREINNLIRRMEQNTSTVSLLPATLYRPSPEQRCAQIIEAVNRRRIEENAFMNGLEVNFLNRNIAGSSQNNDNSSFNIMQIPHQQFSSNERTYFSSKIVNNQSRNQRCLFSPAFSNDTVSIGPNKTKVNKIQFENINWNSPLAATRKLLTLVFSTKILSTHTLSGRPSPAFVGRERPMKLKLDSKKVEDIICTVVNITKISEKDVRGAITMKCANTKKLNNKKRKHLR